MQRVNWGQFSFWVVMIALIFLHLVAHHLVSTSL